MRVCFLSDTHTCHSAVKVPECDILIHCGDVTSRGEPDELARFLQWFSVQPARHRIWIAGNHDLLLDPGKRPLDVRTAREMVRRFAGSTTYLEDSSATVEGFKIYGSPYTPEFYGWAFMEPRGMLAQRWRRIPDDTDILVTHGPAHGKGDRTLDGRNAGCEALRDRVDAIKPLIHAFGHIHEGRGMGRLWVDGPGAEGWWVNASILDRNYDVRHKPVVMEIEPRRAVA